MASDKVCDLNEWFKKNPGLNMEQLSKMTKDSRENMHPTKNAFTSLKSMEPNNYYNADKKNAYTSMVSHFRDLFTQYLGTEYASDQSFTAQEVLNALEEALNKESAWYEDNFNRCVELSVLLKNNKY